MLGRLLVQYSRPFRWLFAAVVVFQLAQSLASLYLPRLNADIIDNGVATGDTSYILRTGAIMLGITFVQIVAALTAVYFGARGAMGMGRDLRRAVYRSVGSFSEEEVQRFGAPSLITRSTNDVQQVQTLVLMSCTVLVTAPIQAVGGVIMAVNQDAVLARVLLITIPLMLVAVTVIVVRMTPLFQSMQRKIDEVNKVLREQLTGIRAIRSFVRERAETSRFARANEDLTGTALRAGRLFALVFPVVNIVLNGSSVAVMWFGAHRIDSGGMQVGSLTAFLTYLTQILMAIMMTTAMAILIPRAAVSGGRIGAVLATESSVAPPNSPVTELPAAGSVEFDAVTFSYPGAEAPVLNNVSFVAPPGKVTAIIGATGSGKTTIVNLAARLMDPSSGTVRIGGVDARGLAESTLYAQLALVPQKAYLFSGTVASNLRYGKPDASDSELYDALDIAQASDYVTDMPDSLGTAISQGGTNISGGQRQRLSIARALVKRAPIMLFDDSLSALDTATDAKLRAALGIRAPEITKIVVAQRVASITNADQILVLENGRITGRGTHRELLETSTTYAEIVDSQLTAEATA